jgi:hypothetical protein
LLVVDALEQLANLLVVGVVATDCNAAAAGLGDRRRRGLYRPAKRMLLIALLAPSADVHRGTRSTQGDGNSLPDAAARAGDDDNSLAALVHGAMLLARRLQRSISSES